MSAAVGEIADLLQWQDATNGRTLAEFAERAGEVAAIGYTLTEFQKQMIEGVARLTVPADDLVRRLGLTVQSPKRLR